MLISGWIASGAMYLLLSGSSERLNKKSSAAKTVAELILANMLSLMNTLSFVLTLEELQHVLRKQALR
jgi:hypothetical protein